MSKSAYAIALRIALILEESSPEELAEAVDILQQCGNNADLLKYLSAASKGRPEKLAKKASRNSKATKPIDQMTSKAVLDLEKSDPSKHQVLAEFDKLVRQGNVLPTNEALRRFGERISKDFRPRAARKDNIGAVMATLAPMAQYDMEKHIKMALDSTPRREAEEYQKLANYLMHGNRGNPT